MDSRKIFYVLVNVFLYCVCGTVIGSDVLRRYRRQLLWPNSTTLQFNVGVGTPSPAKNVNVNFAFQANFQLPWNRTQIPTDILNVYSGYDGESRKKRDARDIGEEKETKDKAKDVNGDSRNNIDDVFVNDKVAGKDMEEDVHLESRNKRDTNYFEKQKKTGEYNNRYVDLKNRRDNKEMKWDGGYENDAKLFHLYKYVEDVLNGFGHDGHSCVKQALCELGAEPLHSEDEEDLLHELASFVLNPVNDVDHPMTEKHEAIPYIQAYRNGQESRRCIELYKNCKFSLVDIFTKTHYLS